MRMMTAAPPLLHLPAVAAAHPLLLPAVAVRPPRPPRIVPQVMSRRVPLVLRQGRYLLVSLWPGLAQTEQPGESARLW